MASIFCCEYLEVEDMIFELVGVLVLEAADTAADDTTLLTAETGVLVTIMVVPLGVRMGLLEILVGSRTGIILLFAVILTNF